MHGIYGKKKRRLHTVGLKSGFVIAVAAILCSLISFVTVAFLITKADGIENKFVGAEVGCEVTEEFDGAVKKSVAVKNSGDTDCYIRARVVFTWLSEDGAELFARLPHEGSDYTVEYADAESNWVEGADGYMYYKIPVKPSRSTSSLIKECRPVEDRAPEGYRLSVEIIASSIQALPTSAVTEAWSSGVLGVSETDGITLTVREKEGE